MELRDKNEDLLNRCKRLYLTYTVIERRSLVLSEYFARALRQTQ